MTHDEMAVAATVHALKTLAGGQFGIEPGYVVMGLRKL